MAKRAAVAGGQFVDQPEPRVVPRLSVFRTRIAEPDDEFERHGGHEVTNPYGVRAPARTPCGTVSRRLLLAALFLRRSGRFLLLLALLGVGPASGGTGGGRSTSRRRGAGSGGSFGRRSSGFRSRLR